MLKMEFRFVALKQDSIATKLGDRKYNDILEVVEDAKTYYRIYLNDLKNDNNRTAPKHFVQVEFDENLLLTLKAYTWTLDNKERSSKLVKDETEEVYLNDIILKTGNLYTYDGNRDIRENDISDEIYTLKRKEFILKNLKEY